MLAELGDIQIPVLALMLLGGCAAKAARAIHGHSVSVGLGPTALFPLKLRPLAAGTLCAVEFGLGIGLIATVGHLGHPIADRYIRFGTCLLFVVATFALIEVRSVRPDIGCGCFGEFSSTPISARTLARSTLLAVAAAAAIPTPPLNPAQLAHHAGLLLLLLFAELALFAALSPEIRDVLVRIGYSAPCEMRVTTPSQTIGALERSKQFRRHAPLLASRQPLDVWREMCWRYVCYPSRYNGRDAELVFAVYLQQRRPAVLSVLVDAATGAVIPWSASSARPAGWRRPLLRRPGSHAAPQPDRPDRPRRDDKQRRDDKDDRGGLPGRPGARPSQQVVGHPVYAIGAGPQRPGGPAGALSGFLARSWNFLREREKASAGQAPAALPSAGLSAQEPAEVRHRERDQATL